MKEATQTKLVHDYNDQQKTIESDVDQLVNSYSAKVVTQYYPEPYFNPEPSQYRIITL